MESLVNHTFPFLNCCISVLVLIIKNCWNNYLKEFLLSCTIITKFPCHFNYACSYVNNPLLPQTLPTPPGPKPFCCTLGQHTPHSRLLSILLSRKLQRYTAREQTSIHLMIQINNYRIIHHRSPWLSRFVFIKGAKLS